MGLPALDEFPRKLWARMVARQARASGVTSLVKPPLVGLPRLRAALAAYLLRARGVEASPEQLIIVPGYEAGLGLTVDALLSRGDMAVVESPSYPPTARLLDHLGLRVRPVPVDAQGLDVQTARRKAGAARLAVVTPSHQSPTGVSLSLARRLELLDWAAQAGIWVLEDDYDGEFRYRGAPQPALKSLDRHDRVIYAGTLSKVLYPGLRLAYLVVPRAHVGDFHAAAARSLHGAPASLMQAVVADFIEEGHFSRHIRRMRTLYAQRRHWLTVALQAFAARGLTVALSDGGMHLLVGLPPDRDDVRAAEAARLAGLGVLALSRWRGIAGGSPGLLASFTNIASEAQAQAVARQLVDAIGLSASPP
jgi:GntR family transcriptional regulator/MocR family aminotransferase